MRDSGCGNDFARRARSLPLEAQAELAVGSQRQSVLSRRQSIAQLEARIDQARATLERRRMHSHAERGNDQDSGSPSTAGPCPASSQRRLLIWRLSVNRPPAEVRWSAMAPMSSARYSEEERGIMLDVALASIRHGLEEGSALKVKPKDYPDALREERGTFVTLHRGGELRGCIGTLEAHQPLISDVAEHAWAAAFQDPRFPELQPFELDDLDIHISVLSPSEPIEFSSEEDLLDKIRPGEDGLILQDMGRRGTFLPSVWEQLPDKHQFLDHLKIKAGLSPKHWSETLKVSRYTTESFGAS